MRKLRPLSALLILQGRDRSWSFVRAEEGFPAFQEWVVGVGSLVSWLPPVVWVCLVCPEDIQG